MQALCLLRTGVYNVTKKKIDKREPKAFIKAGVRPHTLMYIRIDAIVEVTNGNSYFEIEDDIQNALDNLRGMGMAEVTEQYEITNTFTNASKIITEIRKSGDKTGSDPMGACRGN